MGVASVKFTIFKSLVWLVESYQSEGNALARPLRNLGEIGGLFGIKESAMSAGRRRFGSKLEEDEKLRGMAEQVQELLKTVIFTARLSGVSDG